MGYQVYLYIEWRVREGLSIHTHTHTLTLQILTQQISPFSTNDSTDNSLPHSPSLPHYIRMNPISISPMCMLAILSSPLPLRPMVKLTLTFPIPIHSFTANTTITSSGRSSSRGLCRSRSWSFFDGDKLRASEALVDETCCGRGGRRCGHCRWCCWVLERVYYVVIYNAVGYDTVWYIMRWML